MHLQILPTRSDIPATCVGRGYARGDGAVRDPFVGRTFDAVVIDLWKKNRGEVALAEPAVIGPCDDVHELGVKVKTRLVEADVDRRTIRFARVRSPDEDTVGPPRGA